MAAKRSSVSAAEILGLLESRHCKDVFVSECKDGPTHGSHHTRMDAWVMRKSWVRPCATAYEIKVTRGDWLRDDKWRTYLEYCNEFYFVTPPALIEPSELPAEAGLLVVHGSRLVTKRRAPYRELSVPESVYQYVLMCRARISDEWREPDTRENRMDRYRTWAGGREAGTTLARLVRSKLAARMAELEEQIEEQRQRSNALESVRQRVVEMGFDPEQPYVHWKARALVDRLGGEASGIDRSLQQARAALDTISERLFPQAVTDARRGEG